MQLPEGQVLYPGCISQKTNVVEHPELVAWRIKLYASVVGRENQVHDLTPTQPSPGIMRQHTTVWKATGPIWTAGMAFDPVPSQAYNAS